MQSTLPVTSFRTQILETINSNRVTLIRAATGAGKSTQVPKFLVEAGHRVLVTQPRRIAAVSLAQRVAKEMNSVLGGVIGYHMAGERLATEETKCLFVTDGLAVVTEVLNSNDDKKALLILDEIHEWNISIETLVAWVKSELQQNQFLRVVLMSATLESDKLSKFFDNAPVIDIPGRLFDIEKVNPGESIVADISNMSKQGRNTLVFLAGKKEITNTRMDLEKLSLDVEIFELHADVPAEMQQLAFLQYDKPKIVLATNIAQTSITIPDIDAVIDSGLERRVQIVDGVQGLYLGRISKADMEQRRGRAGRTKPGIYCDHGSDAMGQQLDFPVPEIHRSLLDQTVLRLASIGIQMERFDFFHQPKKSDIALAKKTLQSIDCLDDKGNVTEIGNLVADFPVSARSGRMIVASQEYGCVKETIANVAIMEVGGIAILRDSQGNACNIWRQYTKGETQSDVLAQNNLLRHSKKKDTRRWAEMGIDERLVERVLRVRSQLSKAVESSPIVFSKGGSREDQIKSMYAGLVDHVFVRTGSYYVNGDGINRILSHRSVIEPTEYLIAKPFDVGTETPNGELRAVHFVQMASNLEKDWLKTKVA
jgi:HrpA-like RNA helicase